MNSEVIALIGLIGSGKSTYAARFKGAGSLILNSDELMKPLFGQRLTREEHQNNLGICCSYLYSLADQALESGLRVVLDFGFWSRENRDWLRRRFVDQRLSFHYLPITPEEQERRILLRNQNAGSSYTFFPEHLEKLNRFFEDPLKDRQDDILIVANGQESIA